MRRLFIAILLALVAAGAPGCGDGEPEDNAVEAQEGNVVMIGGLR